MSVINEYKDPMSGKVNHFAKGSIKFISIKPVKNPDADGVKRTHIPARNGQPAKVIEATHTISFLMQEVDDNNNVVDPQSTGQWISMGEKKLHANHTDKVQVKFDAGYKDILPGMVASFPLKVSKSGENTYYNGTLSGKVFNILDESKAGQPAPRQPQQQSSAPQGGASGAKVYGEILSIDGNVAVVNDEKQGEGRVVLTDEQLSQVQVGGRLAAFVDLATGNIINSFKAYGPAGQGGGSGGKKTGGYDQVGVETGHAINGFKELVGTGYKVKDELETAKAIHRATAEMKAFVAERTGKPVDSNPVGASAGNAILVALATRFNSKSEVTQELILEHAKDVYQKLSEPLYEYISGLGKVVEQKPAQSAPEPQVGNGTVSAPPVDFDNDPPMDFDDDIPF